MSIAFNLSPLKFKHKKITEQLGWQVQVQVTPPSIYFSARNCVIDSISEGFQLYPYGKSIDDNMVISYIGNHNISTNRIAALITVKEGNNSTILGKASIRTEAEVEWVNNIIDKWFEAHNTKVNAEFEAGLS